MNSVLAGIGTRLADRWAGTLLLPSLLWTALLAVATRLGQTHPFDKERLGAWLDQLSARPAAHAPGTLVLAAGMYFLAAAGVGLFADALSGMVQRLWAIPADRPLTAWLLRRRQRRWDEATRQLKAAILQAAQSVPTAIDPDRAAARVRRCQRRRAGLGPARPVFPTQVGDRFARAGMRIAEVNGLEDLSLVWPRLWAVLPNELRADVTAARAAHSANARLVAWGLLYTALAAIWWPAALIGTTVVVIAMLRAPAGADSLAELIETAADLCVTDLADRLGIPAAPSTADIGRAIGARLHPAVPSHIDPRSGATRR
ncbi:hypothetical protein ACFWMT_19780 [Streptomyces sp. NPDC058368]|uniref:hypothetical protein n=1 Tax=Streptomyces sp. NPDC058368 TaxID=3346461 RepID=UPI003660296D